MPQALTVKVNPLWALLPFWIFVFVFKFGAALHYTLLAPLGERIFPLWIVGLIIGTASLLQLVLDVPAGFVLDRFGYVRVLKIATSCFAIGVLVLLFGLHSWTYLVSIVFGIVGWLFYGPGISAYVLSEAPVETSGRYIGILHAAAALGVVGSTAFLGFVVKLPVPVMGLSIAGLLIMSLISLLFVSSQHRTIQGEKKIAHQAYYVRRNFLHETLMAIKRLDPASTILMLQNFAASVFYGVIWFVIPLVIASAAYHGFPSVGLGVFDLSIVLLGAGLGKLADVANKKILVLLGLLLFAVAAMMVGFTLNIWFLVLGFLATAGDEMSSVSLWSWMDHLDSDHREDGLISGAVTVFEDLGWTVGPILAGFLLTSLGASQTILVGALPLMMLWIVSFTLVSHPHHPHVLSETSRHIPRRLRHKR